MTTRWRKRPTEVEARQLTDETSWIEIARWCGGSAMWETVIHYGVPTPFRWVELPSGCGHRPPARVLLGQWVVRTDSGSWHVFSDDQFRRLFEPAPVEVSL